MRHAPFVEANFLAAVLFAVFEGACDHAFGTGLRPVPKGGVTLLPLVVAEIGNHLRAALDDAEVPVLDGNPAGEIVKEPFTRQIKRAEILCLIRGANDRHFDLLSLQFCRLTLFPRMPATNSRTASG